MGKVELGVLLREARERKGWTQEQAAEQMRRHGLGTTGNYWGKLEAGVATPAPKTMHALSDVLDIPIGRLYQEAGMLVGVVRPRVDATEADLLDEVVEELRDDPQFAESYRLLLERNPTPEVRRAQLQAIVRFMRDAVGLLAAPISLGS